MDGMQEGRQQIKCRCNNFLIISMILFLTCIIQHFKNQFMKKYLLFLSNVININQLHQS